MQSLGIDTISIANGLLLCTSETVAAPPTIVRTDIRNLCITLMKDTNPMSLSSANIFLV